VAIEHGCLVCGQIREAAWRDVGGGGSLDGDRGTNRRKLPLSLTSVRVGT
jgi:hypothetical protein